MSNPAHSCMEEPLRPQSCPPALSTCPHFVMIACHTPTPLKGRPGVLGKRPGRRSLQCAAVRKGEVDLDRTQSLRDLLEKPDILLVRADCRRRRWRPPACLPPAGVLDELLTTPHQTA